MIEPADDEATVRVRRGGAPDPVDETTAISGRGTAPAGIGAGPDTGDAEATAPDEDTPGPRRRGQDDDPVDPVDDDGSTVVARRESRRRQQRADAARTESEDVAGALDGDAGGATRAGRGRGLAATLAADVPAPLGRLARTPEATHAGTPVRSPAAAVVPRTAPPAREAQDLVDTAAAEDARRRRSRRGAAAVVVTASLLAIAAAAALTALVTIG